MNRFRIRLASLALLAVAACGDAAAPVRSASVRQVLTGTAESVEFESSATRQELFRELVKMSQAESGHPVQPALFPVLQNGEFVAAPGLDGRADLLATPNSGDGGASAQLLFPGDAIRRWAQDRRESLQGLSEREAAELVARSLLAQWGIASNSPVEVDRADGAPYAAAYVDGILRINPTFLYLAFSASASATP
ncbi:MAG TPA: hypothetical protein VEY30_12775 [Myxococcaceae bacterium]|nr:hypothetical protein [Myxococcaceae bacterium]